MPLSPEWGTSAPWWQDPMYLMVIILIALLILFVLSHFLSERKTGLKEERRAHHRERNIRVTYVYKDGKLRSVLWRRTTQEEFSPSPQESSHKNTNP